MRSFSGPQQITGLSVANHDGSKEQRTASPLQLPERVSDRIRAEGCNHSRDQITEQQSSGSMQWVFFNQLIYILINEKRGK